MTNSLDELLIKGVTDEGKQITTKSQTDTLAFLPSLAITLAFNNIQHMWHCQFLGKGQWRQGEMVGNHARTLHTLWKETFAGEHFHKNPIIGKF